MCNFLMSTAYSNPIEKVRVCGDGAGWPPYHFIDDHEHFNGYDLDVLSEILPPAGIEFEFSMPPWRRCLVGLKLNTYQIAVSATVNRERAKLFHITKSYYTATPVVISMEGFISSDIEFSDLLEFKVCGLEGYSYRFLNKTEVKLILLHDTYIKTFRQLNSNPCQLLVARKEVVTAHSDWVKAKNEKIDLAISTINGVTSEPFSMLVSKKYSEGLLLKQILDEGIVRLKESGKLDELKAQFEAYR